MGGRREIGGANNAGRSGLERRGRGSPGVCDGGKRNNWGASGTASWCFAVLAGRVLACSLGRGVLGRPRASTGGTYLDDA